MYIEINWDIYIKASFGTNTQVHSTKCMIFFVSRDLESNS